MNIWKYIPHNCDSFSDNISEEYIQYVDIKNNKPSKVIIEGYGIVAKCRLCHRIFIKPNHEKSKTSQS